MKLNICSKVLVFSTALLVTSTSFIHASWFNDWFKEEKDELIEYITIQGKLIGSAFVQSTVEKLSVMAKKHPEAFMKFFLNISDGNAAEVPGEVLQLLKDLEIVGKDAAGVDDLVKIIASWAISQDAAGNPYVGVLQNLIKDGLNDGTIKMYRGKAQ